MRRGSKTGRLDLDGGARDLGERRLRRVRDVDDVPGGRIAASSGIASSSCEVISVEAPVANSTIRRLGSMSIDSADMGVKLESPVAIGQS